MELLSTNPEFVSIVSANYLKKIHNALAHILSKIIKTVRSKTNYILFWNKKNIH